MNDLFLILTLVTIAQAVVFATLGGWVARQKGRNSAEGILLGAVFGPFGVLVELLLPAGNVRGKRLSNREPRPAWLEEIGGQKEEGPVEAWLKDLEDRQD